MKRAISILAITVLAGLALFALASLQPLAAQNKPQGSLPDATFDVDRAVNDNGDDVYYWAKVGNAMLPVMLATPAAQALDVHVGIQSPGGASTQVINYGVGQQVRILNLVNPNPNPNTTYTLTLSVTLQGGAPGPGDQTDELALAFIDADQGMTDCVLCFAEWLGQFAGIDPYFDVVHEITITDNQAPPLDAYYTALHSLYASEITGLLADDPALLWDFISTVDAWAPFVDGLDRGDGQYYVIDSTRALSATNLLDHIKAKAADSLSALIQQEQEAINIPSYVGLDMNQAWAKFQNDRDISDLFLTIILK
jgi:hypothetical protein